MHERDQWENRKGQSVGELGSVNEPDCGREETHGKREVLVLMDLRFLHLSPHMVQLKFEHSKTLG